MEYLERAKEENVEASEYATQWRERVKSKKDPVAEAVIKAVLDHPEVKENITEKGQGEIAERITQTLLEERANAQTKSRNRA